jgi:hypothetical protein
MVTAVKTSNLTKTQLPVIINEEVWVNGGIAPPFWTWVPNEVIRQTFAPANLLLQKRPPVIIV